MVTWPGAVSEPVEREAKVRNAPNFLARMRLMMPASPMQRAMVGFWRVVRSSKASRNSTMSAPASAATAASRRAWSVEVTRMGTQRRVMGIGVQDNVAGGDAGVGARLAIADCGL